MQVLGLAISFIGISIILSVFLILIRNDENNVRYAVSIVYPKDVNIPRKIVQAEMVRMLTRGLIILAVTFVLLLIIFHFVTFPEVALIAHIILIVPVLAHALIFRLKMNRLDREYAGKGDSGIS